ncbi:MAG: hypothetical protein ISR76_10415 [Planctomycetes bacterium]|nr:hypothetical protein [Planctomycetota bacterium]
MTRGARTVLGAAMVVILAALIGTLVCPPISERAEPPDPGLTRPLADPEPAPLDFEAAGGRVPLPTASEHTVHIEVIDADARLPLGEAEVELHYLDRAGNELRSPVELEPDGKVRLPSMPTNRYRISVRHAGFFDPPDQVVQVPAVTEPVLRFELRPAATIRGSLRTVDGGEVASGLVQLVRADDGEFHLCPVDPRGDSFRSPPLRAGVWLVEYLEHAGDRPATGVSAHVAVVPRQVLELRLTIQRQGMRPVDDLVPGIEIIG